MIVQATASLLSEQSVVVLVVGTGWYEGAAGFSSGCGLAGPGGP